MSSSRHLSSFTCAGESEWEAYRDELKRLYFDEDKTISEMAVVMKEKHDFQQPEAQYKKQFRKWHWIKELIPRDPKHSEHHFDTEARSLTSSPLDQDHGQPDTISDENSSPSHFEIQPSVASIEVLLSTDSIPKMHFVENWKQSAVFSEIFEDLGILGRLYRSCIMCYKSLLTISIQKRRLTEAENNILQSHYQLLRLWGDDFGVLEGDIDKILEHSRDLRIMILSIFVSIGKVLVYRLVKYVMPSVESQRVLSGPTEIDTLLDEAKNQLSGRIASDDDGDEGGDNEDGESSSDDSDDDFPTDSIGEVLEDIKAYTSSLIDLIPSIEWPAKDSEEKEAAVVCSAVVDRNPHQYYSDLIRERFPNAAPNLLEHLGHASWERYKRVQNERERNTVMGRHATFNIELDTVGDNSRFDDSGIGSSIPAETSYAQSVISTFSSRADSSRARIPPLPEEAKRGKPFTCDACGKGVLIKNNRDWRKHLYRDLQPYVCFYENCPFSKLPFTGRELWTDHIILEHGLISDEEHVKCPLCCDELPSGRSGISGHLARHMEEISLNALPRGAESEASSETASVDSSDCIDGSVRNEEGQGTEEEGELVRCVCGHSEVPHDSGTSLHIQCDSCHVWQHGICVGVPDEPHIGFKTYFCEVCKPELHHIIDMSPLRQSQYLGGINDSRAPSTSTLAATTPTWVPQDRTGIRYITFKYSRESVESIYTIRTDVESVNISNLDANFKIENCVYPDTRYLTRRTYRRESNAVGWALATLNPELRGKRGLLQRAVKAWRSDLRYVYGLQRE